MSEEAETRLSIEDIPEGEPGADAKRLFYTNFAKERTVRRADGKVYGNWTTSFAGACTNAFEGWIPADAIQDYRRIGSCPGSGEAIVKVENY